MLMPAGLSKRRERQLVVDMLGKLGRKRTRKAVPQGDEELEARALQLSRKYLEGRAEPTSVRWVPAMSTRWASATQTDGTIRVSVALQEVPAYVLDYVVVHELAHLIVPGGHTPEFWATVAAYPQTERAKGYLEAYARFRGVPEFGEAPDPTDAEPGHAAASDPAASDPAATD